MTIYTLLFYALFMAMFQDFLGNEFFIYIILFIISLITGYFFSKKFGDPAAIVKEYLETKHKTLHDFVDRFLIEISIVVPIVLGVIYSLFS